MDGTQSGDLSPSDEHGRDPVLASMDRARGPFRSGERTQAEEAYREALSTYRELAKANPEAYLPDVATTPNNLAILYSETQRMKEAEECCCAAERLLEPLWRANPELHGDLMGRIWWRQALLCELLPDRTGRDACAFAQRAFAAAYHPDIKQATQALIDQFCTDTYF